MNAPAERHILHVDMDAFFAAVEQRDDPALRGRPVLVGGSPKARGVVSAASYEARRFGCHSAMPMAAALRRCPDATVIRPRMERYVDVSRQVFDIIEQFTPLVEPLSIDEAFLDVTGSTRLCGPPEDIGRELKRRIVARTQLTASVGIAPNKFLAKLASDLRKPDGLVIVPSGAVQAFLDPLPIGRLWGAGKVTLQQFEHLGVRTFADARRLSLEQLSEHFGQSGQRFYELLRGEDERPVVPDRQAQSIGHENTFSTDLDDAEHLRAVLLSHTEQVAARLRRHQRLARTVTVKIRTGDFKTITRRRTLDVATDSTDELWRVAAEVLEEWLRQSRRPVRLIGVSVSQLSSGSERQLSLFEQRQDERRRALDRAVDQIRDRFGERAIARGGSVARPTETDPE